MRNTKIVKIKRYIYCSHSYDIVLSKRGASRKIIRRKLCCRYSSHLFVALIAVGGCVAAHSSCSSIALVTIGGLVGNSDFGFRFLGRPEFGIPFPSSEFRNFPAENIIGKPENRSSRKSKFRFQFFRNSRIPLITYIGTLYYPLPT
jgi:hypothetical protein